MDDALAEDIAGLRIFGEQVQRVPTVCDLQFPVGPLRRTDQRRIEAGCDLRVSRDQRRPDGSALAVARAQAVEALRAEDESALADFHELREDFSPTAERLLTQTASPTPFPHFSGSFSSFSALHGTA